MKRRSKMPRSKSRKLFTKTARKTHNKNTRDKPMRGGIRL